MRYRRNGILLYGRDSLIFQRILGYSNTSRDTLILRYSILLFDTPFSWEYVRAIPERPRLELKTQVVIV